MPHMITDYDYPASLAATAVYEAAKIDGEAQRLQNICWQLMGHADYKPAEYSLPAAYIDDLTASERKKAAHALMAKIGEISKDTFCKELADLGWERDIALSSSALGIGSDRGFFAATFVQKNKAGEVERAIIVFRGSSNLFNWIDNAREFSGMDLWPSVIGKLRRESDAGTMPTINVDRMHTGLSITSIAASYTDAVRRRLPSGARVLFTGHSLGAYLALNESVRIARPAILFESPGFSHEPTAAECAHCKARVRTFNAEPNVVNTMGHTVGEMLVVPTKDGMDSTRYEQKLFEATTERLDPLVVKLPRLDALYNPAGMGEVTAAVEKYRQQQAEARARRAAEARACEEAAQRAAEGSNVWRDVVLPVVAAASGITAAVAIEHAHPGAIGRFLGGAVEVVGTVAHAIGEGAIHLVAGLSMGVIDHVVVSGRASLFANMPFLLKTMDSHGMAAMTRRLFDADGHRRSNVFRVLSDAGEPYWPRADRTGTELVSDQLTLCYNVSGHAIAVKSLSVADYGRLYHDVHQSLTQERELLAAYEEELATAQDKVVAAQARHDDLKAQLDAKQDEINLLQEQKQRLQQRHDRLRTDLTKALVDCDLAVDRRVSAARIRRLEIRRAAIAAHLGETDGQIKALSENNRTVRRQRNELRASVRAASTRYEQEQARVSRCETLVETARRRVGRLDLIIAYIVGQPGVQAAIDAAAALPAVAEAGVLPVGQVGAALRLMPPPRVADARLGLAPREPMPGAGGPKAYQFGGRRRK